MSLIDGMRWWAWGLFAIFRAQRRSARRAEVGVAVLLALSLPLLSVHPQPAPSPASSGRPTTLLPGAGLPSPSAAPLAPAAGAPAALYDGAPATGGYSVTRQRGCPAVPAPARVSGAYFPRVVIPRVGINVELHEGNGQSPPDHQWVAWHYPGSADAGTVGNTYVYAHAHGSPPNSAPGLFWPLHYMRVCDAVYVYTSPTSAYRYQAASVNLNWPARDTRPLASTNDDRLTLQTCNAWGDNDPKTIVVALRVDTPPPPPPPPPPPAGAQDSGGASGGSGGGSGGGAPAPQPTPLPCLINCHADVRPASARSGAR